ncbi:MAG TPA: hypothetical protein VM659_21650 [Dongiaceae bacterium]|nr:hypothetical protein [Dongiaceae bacterium]
MQILDIRPGERFWINGPWAYSHRVSTNDDICLVKDDGAVWQMSEAELMDRFAEGSAKHDPDYAGGRVKKTENLLRDLASFETKHVSIAYGRARYLEAIIAHGRPKPMDKKWPEIIASVDLPSHLKRHPSWYVVNRWMKLYDKSDHDVRSLIPHFKKRGRSKPCRSQEESIFLGNLLKGWLRRPAPSKADIWENVDAAYDKAIKTQPSAFNWIKPSKSSVYRMLDEIDPYLKVLMREGERRAREKFKLVNRGPICTERLERVEIDHTVLNLMVVDDDGILLGRPWATIALDCYTRMIVGHYIGFEPPSDYSVAQCIRDMLLPKDYVQKVHGIRLPWNAFGPATTIYVDNAAEFGSETFRDTQALLKTDILLQPVSMPWFKGKVERFMRRLAENRVLRLPGGTSANIIDKDDYDPEKDAVITLSDLRTHFLRWMLTDYCHAFHFGILDVPAAKWEEAIKRMPMILTSRDEVDKVTGFLAEATLTPKGLRYDYLFYHSDELQEILNRGGPGQKVKFRIHMDNMGSITVIHPVTGETHTAFCTWHEYAHTVSKWQHQQMIARQLKAGKEYLRQQEIIDAKIEMMEENERLLAKRKTSGRRRHSRIRGGELVQQPVVSEPGSVVVPPHHRIPAELSAGSLLSGQGPSVAPQETAETFSAWEDDDDFVPRLGASILRSNDQGAA